MTKPFKGLQMRVLNPGAVVFGLPVTADFSTVCDPYAVCRKKSAAMRYQYSTQQDPDQMRKTRIDSFKKNLWLQPSEVIETLHTASMVLVTVSGPGDRFRAVG
jgi:hypothetical protein